MRKISILNFFMILLGASLLLAQTPDLILRKNVTPEYNDYLSSMESAFQQQVAIGNDDAATMKAHLGLALIQFYHMSTSSDSLSSQTGPLLDESLLRFLNVIQAGCEHLAPVMEASNQEEFFAQLTDFFASGEYEELRTLINEQLATIRTNLEQVNQEMADYLADVMSYGQKFGEHWDYVYQHTADFTFVLKYVADNNQETIFIFSRTFFDRLASIEDLGETMQMYFDCGFNYLDAVMPYTGADVMPGVAEIRRGLQVLSELSDSLQVLLSDQPLAPLDLPLKPLESLASFAQLADTILAGAEIPVGPNTESKALVFLALLQHMPGEGLMEVVKGFYRDGEKPDHDFGGIFPRGMPLSWLEMLYSDLVLNRHDDLQTTKAHLNAKAAQWRLLDPIPPDKHMGLALVQIVNLLTDEDYFSQVNRAFGFLSAGRIDSLLLHFQWRDFDVRPQIDAIRYHLRQYYAASAPVNFVILEKEDDVLLNRYAITTDTEFKISFITQSQAQLLESQIHLLEAAATSIINGINELYQELDQIFVLDLDPAKLDFSRVESDLDLILVLESSNPHFLSLTDYGVEKFKKTGEQLREGFYAAMQFCDRLVRLFYAMAPYESDFNWHSEDYILAAMIGRLSAAAFYQDFAHPDSTVFINGERVNLSAWFDNPPASFLQIWKNYVTGVDKRLGGLFPDREYLVVANPPSVVTSFYLHPIYPNPFNPTACIAFDLPRAASVKVMIVDLQGRMVSLLVDDQLPVGRNTYIWDATGLPSGIYFARVETGGQYAIRKMVLIK